MNPEFVEIVNSTFNFLVTDFGYYGPFEYQEARLNACYYVRNKLTVEFGYDDGIYYCAFGKTENVKKDLETGKTNIKQVKIVKYNLDSLVKAKYYELSKTCSNSKDYLNLYSIVINDNKELLTGNYIKLSLVYSLWCKIKSLAT